MALTGGQTCTGSKGCKHTPLLGPAVNYMLTGSAGVTIFLGGSQNPADIQRVGPSPFCSRSIRDRTALAPGIGAVTWLRVPVPGGSIPQDQQSSRMVRRPPPPSPQPPLERSCKEGEKLQNCSQPYPARTSQRQRTSLRQQFPGAFQAPSKDLKPPNFPPNASDAARRRGRSALPEFLHLQQPVQNPEPSLILQRCRHPSCPAARSCSRKKSVSPFANLYIYIYFFFEGGTCVPFLKNQGRIFKPNLSQPPRSCTAAKSLATFPASARHPPPKRQPPLSSASPPLPHPKPAVWSTINKGWKKKKKLPSPPRSGSKHQEQTAEHRNQMFMLIFITALGGGGRRGENRFIQKTIPYQ